jgi:hypothetical protein
LEAFREYGFTPGLQVDIGQEALRHEGMYSLLMRELFSYFGNGQVAVPEYWPDGVN